MACRELVQYSECACFPFFVILRSVVAEKTQVRMDGALTVVDKLSWMRCSMSRAGALE